MVSWCICSLKLFFFCNSFYKPHHGEVVSLHCCKHSNVSQPLSWSFLYFHEVNIDWKRILFLIISEHFTLQKKKKLEEYGFLGHFCYAGWNSEKPLNITVWFIWPRALQGSALPFVLSWKVVVCFLWHDILLALHADNTWSLVEFWCDQPWCKYVLAWIPNLLWQFPGIQTLRETTCSQLLSKHAFYVPIKCSSRGICRGGARICSPRALGEGQEQLSFLNSNFLQSIIS